MTFALSRSERSVLDALWATGGGFIPEKFALVAADLARVGLVHRAVRRDEDRGIDRHWYTLTHDGEIARLHR